MPDDTAAEQPPQQTSPQHPSDEQSESPKSAAARDDVPFSLPALRKLIGMMERHGLSEVSLKRGDIHWKLRRGSVAAGGAVAAPLPTAAPAPMAPTPAPIADPSPPPTAAAPSGPVIKSPTVGTFYASPTPDDPPFVTPGSRVEPETVVCLIEAMKVFNQITADVSGTVAEVLVKPGDSVEFGQPLFRLR